MKRIISILFALCFLFLACSCNGQTPPPTTGGGEQEVFGQHQYDKQSTEHFIVKNGVSNYTIVIPKNYTVNEKNAAEELSLIFRKATNIGLKIVKENEYSGQNAIYIGNTDYSDQVDGEYDDSKLDVSGFRIKTVDKNIVIYGHTDFGTMYGVYGFLTDLVNFEPFTQTYFYVDENLTDVKLYNYDVTDIPDIQIRLSGYSYVRDDGTLLNRMRAQSMNNFFEFFGSKLFHNTFGVLPKDKYQKEHPYWYATDGLNLCFAARGVPDEYEEMMNTVLDELKVYIINHQDSKYITFTHEDNQAWCKCEACTESYNYYNKSNGAVLVKFMNDLRTRLDDWFAGEGAEYYIDVDLIFFAYHATNTSPTRFNEATGEYQPIDNSVICKDGVVPFFAESNGDYTRPFTEDQKVNGPIAKNLKGWNAVSDKMFCWIYGSNFVHNFTIYDTFSAAPETYKYFANNGAYMLFEESSCNGLPTGFGVLKYYLFSKLTWNTDADISELYDRFFKLYFRSAAEPMRAYFDAYRQFATIQKEQLGYEGGRSIFTDRANLAKMWPLQTVTQWKGYIDKAMQAIDYLKELDMDLYDNLYNNIAAERLSTLYMFLHFYSAKFTEEQRAALKQQFYEDTTHLGYTGISAIYEEFGLN